MDIDGYVGDMTWSSLGLIKLSSVDKAMGVSIVTDDLKQFYDVTVPFNRLLNQASKQAEMNRKNYVWFYLKVNHNAEWDIKRQIPWENSMNTTYPGSYDSIVVYNNCYITPEEMGNYLYGYSGSACGFSEKELISGSVFASKMLFKKFNATEFYNEFQDHISIKKGIRNYAK